MSHPSESPARRPRRSMPSTVPWPARAGFIGCPPPSTDHRAQEIGEDDDRTTEGEAPRRRVGRHRARRVDPAAGRSWRTRRARGRLVRPAAGRGARRPPTARATGSLAGRVGAGGGESPRPPATTGPPPNPTPSAAAGCAIVSLRTQFTHPRVLEVAVHLRRGRRSYAPAFQLRRVGDRWRCTALPAAGADAPAGQVPYPLSSTQVLPASAGCRDRRRPTNRNGLVARPAPAR